MNMAKKKTTKTTTTKPKSSAKLISTNQLPEGVDVEAMEKITETVMGANKNLIDHFMQFVSDKKLEKEFKAYCKKNPIVINIGDVMNQMMLGESEDCDCPECVKDGKVEPKVVKKVDTSYIG